MDTVASNPASNGINFLKGFLPFLIVAIHAYYPDSNEYFFEFDFTKNIMLFLSRQLTSFAVPTFFLISGYLFFNKDLNYSLIKRKWNDRIKTLLIPYLIWNSIYILFQVLKPYIFKDIFEIEEYQWNVSSILSAFWNFDGKYPIDAPLWFIRDLMIMCLLTPVINFLTKKTKYSIIIWCFSLFFINAGFGFFSLGAALSIYRNEINLKHISLQSIFYISTILFLSLSIGGILYPTFFSGFWGLLTVCMGVLSIVIFAFKLDYKQNRISSIFVSTSFWVYAIHALIIGLVDKVIMKITYPKEELYLWHISLLK
jgi:surface polysaccharide O-acyltransferase-like enzyme